MERGQKDEGEKRKQSYTRKTEWKCSRSKVRFFSTIKKWAVVHLECGAYKTKSTPKPDIAA